jgi:hypothetical protein
MNTKSPITEGDILESIVSSNGALLSPAAAKALLQLKFPPKDSKRIRQLLQKNNAGTVTAEDRIALEKYLRVGQFLDLLHAKARLALAKRSRAK